VEAGIRVRNWVNGGRVSNQRVNITLIRRNEDWKVESSETKLRICIESPERKTMNQQTRPREFILKEPA
jgi:hypothetical protein